MLTMNDRVKYWLLDKIMDEIVECECAIEAHEKMAKNVHVEELKQVHYMSISDLQDFIKALKEFQDKVRNGEVVK